MSTLFAYTPTLDSNVSKQMQQTTFSNLYFGGILRVNLSAGQEVGWKQSDLSGLVNINGYGEAMSSNLNGP